MSHGERDTDRTTLTGRQKEEFIRTFAPALLQVLRRSGQPNASDEDILASLRDPKSKIEFETPSGRGSAMVACVITDLHVVKGGNIEVVIRRRER